MSSRLSLGARVNLVFEVVTGGLVELWSHKLRSVLTLTLLMLGVFALVVLTSVLDGVLDKVGTGFEGMAWDGTVVIQPKGRRDDGGAEAVRHEPGPALRGPRAHRRPLRGRSRLPAAGDRSRPVCGSPKAPSASSSPASRRSTRCS